MQKTVWAPEVPECPMEDPEGLKCQVDSEDLEGPERLEYREGLGGPECLTGPMEGPEGLKCPEQDLWGPEKLEYPEDLGGSECLQCPVNSKEQEGLEDSEGLEGLGDMGDPDGPECLKVGWIQNELMRSSFLPKCQSKITSISALEVYLRAGQKS